MFIDFFYLMRAREVKVSMDEWLMLIEALDKGLCPPSLLAFYHLCRATLIKSESEYDKFDQAFYLYFKNIERLEDIPDEVWEWLSQGEYDDEAIRYELWDKYVEGKDKYDLKKLQRMLEERLQEQKEAHHGGNYWIGTGGTSPLGVGGFAEQGIRVSGEGKHRSALQVAQKRDYRDFREDNILDTRQFQMAFRKLRQFSSNEDIPRTELDIDGTIKETSDHAGLLNLVWERPRKNSIKLLILFDSDGSMRMHSRLCSALFQAVSKSNHFSDLKVYYFHNCIYDHLYTTPACRRGDWVETDKVLRTLNSDYRVIIIGDATMAPSELFNKGGNSVIGLYNDLPGIEWLNKIRKKYPHHIWLNPLRQSCWHDVFGHYTLEELEKRFPMYELSLNGLEKGVKHLLVNR